MKTFKFSFVMPNSFIIGLPTKTEEDPVMAKTIKMRIISQRCSTNHLFSNFLNKYRKKRINKKLMTRVATIVTAIGKVFVNARAILYAVYTIPIIPKKGNNNCQFSLICQRFLNCSITYFEAAKII